MFSGWALKFGQGARESGQGAPDRNRTPLSQNRAGKVSSTMSPPTAMAPASPSMTHAAT